MTCEERWSVPGLHSLVKRWLSGDLNAVYPSVMGGCRKGRARCLLGIGLRMEQMNFWSDIRKNFFYPGGGQALEQRTGDVEFTTLEIFKTARQGTG